MRFVTLNNVFEFPSLLTLSIPLVNTCALFWFLNATYKMPRLHGMNSSQI